MSELIEREPEIRAAAEGCETLAEFRMKFPTWSMETVRRAVEIHNLTFHRPGTKTAPRVAQACPKPMAKGAKS